MVGFPNEMSKGTSADQEFLEYLVKSLVDHPSDVRVDRKVDEMGVLLTLKVHAEDMGQIIGRQGNTAKAIRSILRVVGMKNNARVNLKIEEPEGGRGPRPRDGEGEDHQVTDRGMDSVIDELKL
ncbi:MAG: KH domain-containing protein [Patescibacteria group bacterium]